MLASTLPQRLRGLYHEYPSQFWTLFAGLLIYSFGGGLVNPFLSLYLTRTLGFTMTQVGVIYSFYAAVAVAAQLTSGVLVDRLGRKPVMLFAVFGNAVAVMAFALGVLFVQMPAGVKLAYVAAVILLNGLTNNTLSPATNAMIADLIEERRRGQAYGLIRVAINLGIACGPTVGGLIAVRSYPALFSVAAVAFVTFGVIAIWRVQETCPAAIQGGRMPAAKAQAQPVGLRSIGADGTFLALVALMTISYTVYAQTNTTLPVFLNRQHGVSEQWFGLMMSMNAALVVLFQFPLTRFTDRYARPLVMAAGMSLFAAGFGLYGLVASIPLFFLAQATWTSGEMVSVPTGQAFTAELAPPAMRGRYMSIYSLAMAIGYGIGPLLGGLLMDRLGGYSIWLAAFLLDAAAMGGFVFLWRMRTTEI